MRPPVGLSVVVLPNRREDSSQQHRVEQKAWRREQKEEREEMAPKATGREAKVRELWMWPFTLSTHTSGYLCGSKEDTYMTYTQLCTLSDGEEISRRMPPSWELSASGWSYVA